MYIVPKIDLSVTRTYIHNNIGLDHFTAQTKQTLAYFLFQSYKVLSKIRSNTMLIMKKGDVKQYQKDNCKLLQINK